MFQYIAYGSEGEKLEHIIHAAKMAQMHKFVETLEGYQTILVRVLFLSGESNFDLHFYLQD